eukprot:m.19520 g.19520  ORF g.19520 m.19520 type:complete len:381 (+) comp5129_c0_seq2:137-1279(+)
MAREIGVTIAKHLDAELRTVNDHLEDNVHVHNLVVLEGKDNVLLQFQTTNRRARECIESLQLLGVGSAFGSIEIFELKSVIPRLSNHPTLNRGSPKGKEYNTSISLTLEEIYETVEKGYHLTFEYLGLCACGSIVCAVGLVTNSDPTVVASMLLSPLMGPILGITLGSACRDATVTIKAIKNEFIGVFITLLFGIITGLIVAVYEDEDWSTDEMLMRGLVSGLAPGVIIALPCGVALAISVTSADGTILVGVAIAAALLPPIVNAGLELSFGMIKELPYHEGSPTTHLQRSANSFVLFLLNWIAIYIGCLIVFAMKRVRPRIFHMAPRKEREYDSSAQLLPDRNTAVSTTSSSSKTNEKINEDYSESTPLIRRDSASLVM